MHWRTAKGPTGASTVSTTPAVHALPVSLTPAKTCFIGVIDTGEVKASLTGVVDTGKELFTGVNVNGNACIAGVVDTGEAPK
jgi:hypothetical protein